MNVAEASVPLDCIIVFVITLTARWGRQKFRTASLQFGTKIPAKFVNFSNFILHLHALL